MLRGLEQACDGAENTLRCTCNGFVPTACTEGAAARKELRDMVLGEVSEAP